MEPSTPEPELLQQRPEARAIRVEDLLGFVRNGRVRIPSFQRGLKWKRDDALSLLDSIYRGYPIGTLLLWQTRAEAGEVQFGTISIAAPGRPDAWWVVDGQQRIVALARTLLASYPSSDEYSLRFDLDEARFMFAPRLPTDDATRWLPLEVTLDSQHLIAWLLEHVSTNERQNRAIQLGKRLREYDIPAYVVTSDSENALREIFGRSNNAGKRLTASEVFDALHGARSADRPATLAQIADEMTELGFGQIDTKILFRLLRVLSGAEVSGRSGKDALRMSGDQALEAYARTARAMKAVVLFLKRDVGIPHYALLPYKQPMVTLGKFFHLHPAPKSRSRELLARWFWRGALTGLHRGDTVSTRRALDRIDEADEEASIQRMLEQISTHPQVHTGPSEPFNFRHAVSKLQTLALLDLRPRDLDSGAVLPVRTLFDQRANEVPVADVVSAGVPAAMLQSVANRVVHPGTGIRQRLLATSDAAVLDSHVVAEDAQLALRKRQGGEFLRLRASNLAVHFKEFFDRQARWQEADRPSIESLTVKDDD